MPAGEGLLPHHSLQAKSSTRMVVRTVDLGSARVSASAELYQKYRDFYPGLQEGIRILGDFFENPPLEAKPSYWLLENEDQMKAVLEQAVGEKDEDRIRRALAEGIYRSGSNFAVILSPTVSRENLARLIFTRYAKSLIEAMAPTGGAESGWFAPGLSAYAGWMAEGEREKKKRNDYEREMRAYYATLLSGSSEGRQSPGTTQKEWSDSLQKEPAAAYARAALAYLDLVDRSNPSAGVAILRLLEEGESFPDAFQRGAGFPLSDLGGPAETKPAEARQGH